MTLVRYEPWAVMNRLHRQIDQIFGDNVGNAAANGEAAVDWLPPIDIHEAADKFVLLADVPGVEPKDIEITAENGVLTVRGRRQFEAREQQQGFQRLERAEGAFLRRFTLPERVQADAIKARHSNGVLEVTIPKVAAPEPRRVNIETH